MSESSKEDNQPNAESHSQDAADVTSAESPWAIIGSFTEDLAGLGQILQQHGSTDFVARLYIRTFFSMIDGYAYYVKQRAARCYAITT